MEPVDIERYERGQCPEEERYRFKKKIKIQPIVKKKHETSRAILAST